MDELSIEEREFNLNKRIALFENRLNMQLAMLSLQYLDLVITDVQANIYAKAMFIDTSISLIRERLDIKSQLFNRFKSGGILEDGREIIYNYGGMSSGMDLAVKEWLKKHPEAKIIKR